MSETSIITISKADAVVIKHCPDCGALSLLQAGKCWRCPHTFRTQFQIIRDPGHPVNWLVAFCLGLLIPLLVICGFMLGQLRFVNDTRITGAPDRSANQQANTIVYYRAPVAPLTAPIVANPASVVVIMTATPLPVFVAPQPVPFVEVRPAPVAACDPSYPTLCIPLGASDLDCRQILDHDFPVLPPDRHNLDGDHDGVGCET